MLVSLVAHGLTSTLGACAPGGSAHAAAASSATPDPSDEVFCCVAGKVIAASTPRLDAATFVVTLGNWAGCREFVDSLESDWVCRKIDALAACASERLPSE